MSDRVWTRRRFLGDVGRGALLATLGPVAGELGVGLPRVFAEEPPPLSFGPLEPLVALLQETPIDRLIPVLVERLRTGTDLRTLVAAGALANARTFGGEDYVGFHSIMALGPAYHMAQESAGPGRALPVLKVLYRSGARIQEVGGRRDEVLRAVRGGAVPATASGETLRDAVRAREVVAAERTLEALGAGSAERALEGVLFAVEDDAEVHRVALAYRSWDLVDAVGAAHATTLLRQSVHYCVRAEPRAARDGTARAALAAALEKAGSAPAGTRAPDDAWVERTSLAIFSATPEDAAEIATAAWREGIDPAAIGESVGLAANQILLRDGGRTEKEARPEKPVGSVHGDSIGLHAQDAANAWRNLARVGTSRHALACLVLGAYQVARDRVARGGDFLVWRPRPLPDASGRVSETSPEALLARLEGAVREGDQEIAAAAVARYGERGHAPGPAFDVFRRYATTEDGALHAEKYFRTASEDFGATRPAFRWRHLVSLARVTASEFGRKAAGVEEARRLLGA